MRNTTPHQFSLFRIVLGVTLFFYFLFESLGETSRIFIFSDLLLATFSAAIALGIYRRWIAFISLGLWSLHFKGLNISMELLTVCLLAPHGEPWSKCKTNPHWQLSPLLYWGAWLGLGLLLLLPEATQSGRWLALLPAFILLFNRNWLPAKTPSSEESPIVFFDGVCGLCNGFIDFLFMEDQARLYKVATLQGQTAQEKLSASLTKNLATLVVLRNGQTLTKSDAVLSVLEDLGGLFKVLSLFRALPKTLRDFIYTLIATNRYKIFGIKESCRLPTPEERGRFLP